MKSAQRPRELILSSEHGYDAVRAEVSGGSAARIRRGAYLRTPADPTDDEDEEDEWDREERLLLARCHAVGSTLTCRYAFARETAGFLLQWPAPVQTRMHIVQTSRRPSGGSRDLIRHHTNNLPDEEIVIIEGLPVTAPARTAIDSALGCEPPLGLALVDAALGTLAEVSRFDRAPSIERQDLWRARLFEMLDARGSVRHTRRAREVIRYSDGLSESGQESRMRWLALSNGMPVPELQLEIGTSRGPRYPDAMWWFDTVPGARPLLAEYDGARKYRRKNAELAVIEEKDREALLKDATGGEFVRFTKHDRPYPDAAFARLLRASPLSVDNLTPRPALFRSRSLTR